MTRRRRGRGTINRRNGEASGGWPPPKSHNGDEADIAVKEGERKPVYAQEGGTTHRFGQPKLLKIGRQAGRQAGMQTQTPGRRQQKKKGERRKQKKAGWQFKQLSGREIIAAWDEAPRKKSTNIKHRRVCIDVARAQMKKVTSDE
jgi:hypothetical protein